MNLQLELDDVKRRIEDTQGELRKAARLLKKNPEDLDAQADYEQFEKQLSRLEAFRSELIEKAQTIQQTPSILF